MTKPIPKDTSIRDSHVCHIVGSLDRPIDEIERVLASGSVDLTLDFSGCTFLSVSGLEWLEEILLRADSLKAKIHFVNLGPTVYKVLKVAHIDSLLRACGAPMASGPAC
jgi:anti-anti-sigma regulatory factor